MLADTMSDPSKESQRGAKARVLSSLRRRAKSLGVDVDHLSDKELEGRLVENSKAVASKIAVGVEKTAKEAVSRAVRLGKDLKGRRGKP